MTDTSVLEHFSRYWWTFALRGVLLIAFGVLALILPGLTLAVLILLFGAFAVADGLFALIVGVQSQRWSLLVLSVLAIGAGVIAFLWPGVTALVLLLVIAAWAVVRGAYEIATAIALRNEIEYEWLLGISGALLFVLGILLFLFPAAGLLSLVWIIGLVALISGVLLLIGAYRLRGLPERIAHAAH